jgi:hypothetical protein
VPDGPKSNRTPPAASSSAFAPSSARRRQSSTPRPWLPPFPGRTSRLARKPSRAPLGQHPLRRPSATGSQRRSAARARVNERLGEQPPYRPGPAAPCLSAIGPVPRRSLHRSHQHPDYGHQGQGQPEIVAWAANAAAGTKATPSTIAHFFHAFIVFLLEMEATIASLLYRPVPRQP